MGTTVGEISASGGYRYGLTLKQVGNIRNTALDYTCSSGYGGWFKGYQMYAYLQTIDGVDVTSTSGGTFVTPTYYAESSTYDIIDLPFGRSVTARSSGQASPYAIYEYTRSDNEGKSYVLTLDSVGTLPANSSNVIELTSTYGGLIRTRYCTLTSVDGVDLTSNSMSYPFYIGGSGHTTQYEAPFGQSVQLQNYTSSMSGRYMLYKYVPVAEN